MASVSIITIIIVVLVIATILTTIAYFVSGRKGKTFLVEYATVITGVSVILLIASFAYQYADGQQQEIEQRERDRISLTSEVIVDIEKEFSSNYPYLQRMYSQIYPMMDVDVPVVDETVARDQEQHMAQILFRHMQSIFSFDGGLRIVWEDVDPEWLSIFRRWFSSPILRREWERTSSIYPQDLNTFISKQILPYTI